MSSGRPLVSVCMITYNHEAFIAEAIESILMQECNFKIELIIADDNSPDNTESVIDQLKRDHPNADRIKYTKHIVNKGMMKNFLWALEECRGKYIAFCEGDDYWISPLKLQEQVDFLEANKDYGLIHTDYYKFHQKNKKYERNSVLKIRNVAAKSTFHDLLIESNIHTATVCLRKDILKCFLEDVYPEAKNTMLGDYQIWLYFSHHSKIKYLPLKMAVYRILENSASNRKNRLKGLEALKSIHDVRYYFINKYGCKEEVKRVIDNQFLMIYLLHEINVGYDLKDYNLVKKCLSKKNEKGIPVTFLDRIKLLSTKHLVVWRFSLIILSFKRFLSQFSNKYIRKIPEEKSSIL